MCVTSMVGDHYADKWKEYPWIQPGFQPVMPYQPLPPGSAGAQPVQYVPRHEFDKLKAEVEEMKALLKRAKAYDEANNEPECEIDEKMDLLRKVAKMVGVDLDDVIGKAAP